MSDVPLEPPAPLEPAAPDGKLRCERIRLLLSLNADEATTTEQDAEIDAHVVDCADCVDAAVVDRAVRARLHTPAVAPEGFAARVAARVARQRMIARSQNRFVMTAGAAAVAAAGIALLLLGPTGSRERVAPSPDRVRANAGMALSASLARGRLNRIEDR